ncbi:MAG: hypothetical protein KJO67_09565 [Silicimonas sp.]|nr:hypothetical protein [Silicimonas sp.]
MPSIQDDNAQTLMNRRSIRQGLQGVVTERCVASTARILPFDAPMSRASTADRDADCVDLAQARSARDARLTVAGVFHYVPRL